LGLKVDLIKVHLAVNISRGHLVDAGSSVHPEIFANASSVVDKAQDILIHTLPMGQPMFALNGYSKNMRGESLGL